MHSIFKKFPKRLNGRRFCSNNWTNPNNVQIGRFDLKHVKSMKIDVDDDDRITVHYEYPGFFRMKEATVILKNELGPDYNSPLGMRRVVTKKIPGIWGSRELSYLTKEHQELKALIMGPSYNPADDAKKDIKTYYAFAKVSSGC